MGIGGGGGDSQGWTVKGRDLTLIHVGQPDAFISSRPGTDPSLLDTGLGFTGFGSDPPVHELILKVSLDKPTFLRATFVVMLDSIF